MCTQVLLHACTNTQAHTHSDNAFWNRCSKDILLKVFPVYILLRYLHDNSIVQKMFTLLIIPLADIIVGMFKVNKIFEIEEFRVTNEENFL